MIANGSNSPHSPLYHTHLFLPRFQGRATSNLSVLQRAIHSSRLSHTAILLHTSKQARKEGRKEASERAAPPVAASLRYQYSRKHVLDDSWTINLDEKEPTWCNFILSTDDSTYSWAIPRTPFHTNFQRRDWGQWPPPNNPQLTNAITPFVHCLWLKPQHPGY